MVSPLHRLLRVLRIVPLVLLTTAAPLTTACKDSTSPDGSKCCKVCRQGKACGDSCISTSDTCTKSAGCACNG